MADFQRTNSVYPHVVDKRLTRTTFTPLAEAANLDTIAKIKARLTVLAPASYTTARMNSMTVNDLIYALRLSSSDAAGIK